MNEWKLLQHDTALVIKLPLTVAYRPTETYNLDSAHGVGCVVARNPILVLKPSVTILKVFLGYIYLKVSDSFGLTSLEAVTVV